MKNARKIMLCCWYYTPPKNTYSGHVSNPYPYILIKGRWFQDYGFNIGDQVMITNPKPGVLVMKVAKTAKEMQAIRERNNQNVKLLVNDLRKQQRLEAA